jgi:acyl-coenzyme A thioesterase PaaI-like protein
VPGTHSPCYRDPVRNSPEPGHPDPRTLPATLLAKFTTDPAGNTAGVRLAHATAPDEVAFAQRVQAWQRDRQGRAGLASLGILLDVTAGSGIYLLRPENEYVVSHISVSMAPWEVIGDEVIATASPLAVDDHTGTGLATARMESGTTLIAAARCRSVQTVRPNLPDDLLAEFRSDPAAFDDQQPLSTHLGLTRINDGSSADRFGVRWQVPEWTLNSLGTAQGGSILSATAAVTDIVGDALRDEGAGDCALTDLSIELMRSPSPSAAGYEFAVDIIRRGRRLVVMTIDLRDESGKLFARSTATLCLRTP